MFRSGALHRLLLALLALTHLGAGVVLAAAGLAHGTGTALPVAGLALALPGLILGVDRFRPAPLSRPASGIAAGFALACTVALSAGGVLPALFLAGPVDPSLAALAFVPALALAAMLGTLLLPLAAFLSTRDAVPAAPRRPVIALPAVGAAMKLYVAADWLALRGFGAALLATGWLIHTLSERGVQSKVDLLSYGYDPTVATYAYGLAGVLLLLPAALPMGLAAPRHIVGGLLKAVLLVGVAYGLMMPLEVLIDTHAPALYRPALRDAVPPLFKAVSGIAVASALLIAFFRQLNRPERVDHMGRPVVTLSASEMAAMRRDRMGTAAYGGR
jgi:hypothetical protein